MWDTDNDFGSVHSIDTDNFLNIGRYQYRSNTTFWLQIELGTILAKNWCQISSHACRSRHVTLHALHLISSKNGRTQIEFAWRQYAELNHLAITQKVLYCYSTLKFQFFALSH